MIDEAIALLSYRIKRSRYPSELEKEECILTALQEIKKLQTRVSELEKQLKEHTESSIVKTEYRR